MANADGVMGFERMPQRQLAVDHVVVAPAVAFAVDDAGVLEFADDPLHGALGDAHPLGHLADADVRFLGQAQEHVAVVAEEGPHVVVGRHPMHVQGSSAAP